MWSVSSILSGLLSFMLENTSTVGSIESTPRQKQQFALMSMQENLKNIKFCKMFPHHAKRGKEQIRARAVAAAAANVAAAAAAAVADSEANDTPTTDADAGSTPNDLRRRPTASGVGMNAGNSLTSSPPASASSAPQGGTSWTNMFMVTVVAVLAVLSFVYV
jgi:hypothetical protein